MSMFCINVYMCNALRQTRCDYYRLLCDELSEGLLERAELSANAQLQLFSHTPELPTQIPLALCKNKNRFLS